MSKNKIYVNSPISLVSFACLILGIYLIFHLKQITYVVDSKINEPKIYCSTVDLGEYDDSILLNTDCTEIAYLSDHN